MQPRFKTTRTFTLVLASCWLAACGQPAGDDQVAVAALPIDSLVTAEWLAENLDAPDLVVLDASVMIEETEGGGFHSVSGLAHYNTQHIPGARFADLTGDLVDTDSPLKFAVPTPEAFAAAMSRLGVGDNSRVVIYDANGSGWAARVWWMLRWIGFDNAALLDGGLDAWTSGGGAVSSDLVNPAAGTLSVHLRPELIADRDEVLAAIDNDGIAIIDALPESHYKGEFSLYERPGHIPGASNVSAGSLSDDSGRFKPAEEVRALFDGDLDGRAINYCGGGISASTNAFVMTRLGYKDVAVYTASLQEWAADPENPLVTE